MTNTYVIIYAIGIEIRIQPSELDVMEGSFEIFEVQGSGISFGNIPVLVTMLACSDYPGNLGDLFSDIPAVSADPGMLASKVVTVNAVIWVYFAVEDLENSNPQVVNLDLRSIGFPIVADSVYLLTAVDGLDEPEECLVLTLSINETALDSRDQGRVDFVNSVALVRIEDVETGEQYPSLSTLLYVFYMHNIIISTEWQDY